MIRRPPRSTQSRSSAASDVYKRQTQNDERSDRQIQILGAEVEKPVETERKQSLKSNGGNKKFKSDVLDKSSSLIVCMQGRAEDSDDCLLYTSPSPRDRQKSRMPSSA
eukprot:TRINITY_DN6678_c0_g1_i1.p3 TRINITY_DN6678_c0_g1~~TRINITY_DN6678_c0_g1_i1.p3  ORF type:complete len:108 (+),score=57.82 TRINITY_DN6678_c0_g1_i1:13-336(+)